jgi:hypothetical protein
MIVIIKARPGTIAPPEKRIGVDLPVSITVQTVVRSPENETGTPTVPALSDTPHRGDAGRQPLPQRDVDMLFWSESIEDIVLDGCTT